MSSVPVPDERTIYSSRRRDDVDALAWPVFSEHALGMLRSGGEVLHPEPGELLWDAGDPYDLNLVLGMLMGQRAFLPGVAMEGTTLLRVRVEELRRLMEISGELSDVLLAAFDARRRQIWRGPVPCPRRARPW
jgi:thioredoxin reductase (NADPH)